MISENLNIFEYEEVLMGKRQKFECSFVGTEREKYIEIGNIWRYAITHLLKWTPEEALVYLTDDIVKELHLDKTLKAIGYEKNGRKCIVDYSFILQHAFPDKIKFDIRKEAIAEYEKIAKIGKWANDNEPFKYPKKFFLDCDGIIRANCLLLYVTSLYLSDMTISEQYEFFSDTSKAKRWLKKKCLDSPIKLIYKNPLEYFHDSLPYNQKDEYIYYKEIANQAYKRLETQFKSA